MNHNVTKWWKRVSAEDSQTRPERSEKIVLNVMPFRKKYRCKNSTLANAHSFKRKYFFRMVKQVQKRKQQNLFHIHTHTQRESCTKMTFHWNFFQALFSFYYCYYSFLLCVHVPIQYTLRALFFACTYDFFRRSFFPCCFFFCCFCIISFSCIFIVH